MTTLRVQLAEDGKSLEIFVYDDIGDDWWGDGISARSISQLLKQHSGLELITLRVNSLGGSAFDGDAIYNQLRRHKARVEVDVDGVAASAASVVVMAGDEIRMAENAMLMIHEAWGTTRGPASDHRTTADLLEKVNMGAAKVYARRSGKTEDEMLEKMAAETWFTAAEAVEIGLADKVTEAKQIESKWDPKMLARFKNAPASLMGEAGAQQSLPLPAPQASAKRPARPEESDNMDPILLQALGLKDDATDAQAATAITTLRGFVQSVEQLAGGKSGDEALGVLQAYKAAHGELATLKEQIETNRKAAEEAEHAALLEQAQKDRKIMPAQAEFWRGQTLAALKGFLAVATPIVSGEQRQPGPDAAPKGPQSAPTWQGKTYADLSGPERAKLHGEDAELAKQMRDHYHANLADGADDDEG